MMNDQLRCSSTSFTRPACPPEYFSPVGFVFRGGFVSLPHIFHCWQDVVLYLHLLQIRMRPVSLDPRSMIDEFGLRCSIAPDPFPICFLGCKFISASFRPRLMWHKPSSHFLWPDTVLLLQPFSQPKPDVTIKLVEGFCRVHCSVVDSPSSNDRIDGLYLAYIVVVGRAPCGHRFDFRLHPLQAFVGGTHKYAYLSTICGSVTAKNAEPQEFKPILDMSDLRFLFGQLSSHFVSEECLARLLDALGLC